MSASNAFETDILEHIFENAAIANIGDAGGLQPSAAAGSLYVGLHTGDPGEAGDQTTSECNYTGYARVAVARTDAKWTIAANSCKNADAIAFPAATGGSNTATHFSIGTAASAAGNLLFKSALDSSLAISSGITPEFAAEALEVTAD
jgi:hypothetical protein